MLNPSKQNFPDCQYFLDDNKLFLDVNNQIKTHTKKMTQHLSKKLSAHLFFILT